MKFAVFTLICFLAATLVSADYHCYQCVSTSDNESDCEESDPAKLKQFIKTCPPLKEGTFKDSAAVGCRKIIQTVESRVSTIRECAYSGEPVSGLKKTGNWGINMYYYQCENSGDDPCNSASSPTIIALTLLLSYATLILQ